MNIIFLLALTSLGLFFLILHSFYFRGKRITFNFFFFAFLISFMKEVHSPRAKLIFPIPYELTNRSNNPVFLNQLTIALGWVFAFYLSWCLAEGALRRLEYFRARLFTALFLSGLVMGSISYSLETTGIAMGWWEWTLVKTLQFKDIFVYCPFIAIKAWTYFGIHFLAAFFLIECSPLRKKNWKNIFFLIPLAHIWIVRFFGGKISLELEGTPLFFIFAVLGLISRLPLENGIIKDEQKNMAAQKRQLISAIPLIIVLYMVGVLIAIDSWVLKQPKLIVSILPLIFLVLLYMRSAPFILILLFSLAAFALFGRIALPALVPVSLVLILLSAQKIRISPKKEKECV